MPRASLSFGAVVFLLLGCDANDEQPKPPPSSVAPPQSTTGEEATAQTTAPEDAKAPTKALDGPGPNEGTGGPGGHRMASRHRRGRVDLGTPTVSAGLPPDLVRRVVRIRWAVLTQCYDDQLYQTPNLTGRITATFSIEPSGTVSEASASGVGPVSLADCFAATLKGATFPKRKDDATAKVLMDFNLRPHR